MRAFKEPSSGDADNAKITRKKIVKNIIPVIPCKGYKRAGFPGIMSNYQPLDIFGTCFFGGQARGISPGKFLNPADNGTSVHVGAEDVFPCGSSGNKQPRRVFDS
jgi:hypothetical protein